jgi:MFS family permease
MASSVAEPARVGTTAKRGVVVAVAVAVFCVDVDFFALNLALPAIARELHVTTTDLQWAIAVYQLTLASFLIPGGRLGDLLGRKRVLLAGIGIFGFASLLCGASQSAEMLIGARFVQGLGASLLFPVGISVISNTFPVAERGKAIGNVYGVGSIGTAVGPFVGGLLTDVIDWRWVFFFNVPFALAALVLTVRHVDESRDTSAQGIDFRGLVAITAGIAAVTYAIDRGSTWGWLMASTLILAAAGIALLFAFRGHRAPGALPARRPRPLPQHAVRPRHLRGHGREPRLLPHAVPVDDLPQQVRDLSPLLAGVVFLGPALANAAAGLLAGRLGRARQPAPPRHGRGAGHQRAGAVRPVDLHRLALVHQRVHAGRLRPGHHVGLCQHRDAGGGARIDGRRRLGPDPRRRGRSGRLAVVVGATILEVLTAHGNSTTDAIQVMMAVLAGLAALAALALASCGRLIRARAAP